MEAASWLSPPHGDVMRPGVSESRGLITLRPGASITPPGPLSTITRPTFFPYASRKLLLGLIHIVNVMQLWLSLLAKFLVVGPVLEGFFSPLPVSWLVDVLKTNISMWDEQSWAWSAMCYFVLCFPSFSNSHGIKNNAKIHPDSLKYIRGVPSWCFRVVSMLLASVFISYLCVLYYRTLDKSSVAHGHTLPTLA